METTSLPFHPNHNPPPLYQWPVLRIRMVNGAPVATGPSHAAFGNPRRASPSVDVPTDPWAEWTWDSTRLIARTDRYGFSPLFYQIDPDGIRISPSLITLLESGASKDIDDAGLAVMLRTGFFVGEDTAFRNIRIVPPHGVLTWEGGKTDVRGSLVTVQQEPYTRTSAVDAYIERFREAVRRRPSDGMTILPLSGGRDSRHIFLELCAQGRAPDIAVTIGPPPAYHTEEVIRAHQVAVAAGVQHLAFRAPDPQWPAENKTRVDTHFATTDHWWLQTLLGYLDFMRRSQPLPLTVYEGVAGDVLSTFIRKTPERERLYAEGKFEPLAEVMLDDEGYLPRMLRPELYRRLSREAARVRLAEELARHANQAHPLASFIVYNRTRRVTGLPPSSLMGPLATVWCPYLDADVFDFLMSLPPSILVGQTIQEFHDTAIKKAYPKFADIPFASKNVSKKRLAPLYQMKLIRDMTADLMQHKPNLIKPAFLYARLARATIDVGYWKEVYKISSLSNYLLQLSRYTA